MKKKAPKRERTEEILENLLDFQYELLSFHFLPICRSDILIYALCFFTCKSNWLLIVVILFDVMQVFFYFPQVCTLKFS